ncbi:MAG TPA: hypothetical protein VGH28_16995 [Polyangiaceae bacterium]|jgi:hypothetical protein
MKRHLRNLLAFCVLAVSVWMSFDGVFSDDGPIRAQAEQVACTKKKCDAQHGVTSESRSPFGQTLGFTWADATIKVHCHRAYYVFGARECAVE